MKTKIIFLAIGWLLFLLSSTSSAVEHGYLSNLLNKFISLYYADNKIHKIGEKISVGSFKGELFEIVRLLRDNGIFAGCYKIKKEDLEKLPLPFLIFLSDGEIILVKDLRAGKFIYIDKDLQEKTNNSHQILSRFTGVVISEPPLNVWLQPKIAESTKGKFYIIFTYHDEDFNLVKRPLEFILNEIKKENKKPLYIDELGLIPEKAIETKSKIEKVTPETAFQRAKEMLRKDIAMIEKGIAPYDSNPMYYSLYRYLVEKRVKSVIEDLRYSNWRKITYFDNLNLNLDAQKNFMNGDIWGCLDYLIKYAKGFWLYNIKIRDGNLISQIENLFENYPGHSLFTIRGLAHLGLEEALAEKGYEVEFFIIGEGDVRKNLIAQQLLQVYTNYGVKMEYPKVCELLLKGIFLFHQLHCFMIFSHGN